MRINNNFNVSFHNNRRQHQKVREQKISKNVMLTKTNELYHRNAPKLVFSVQEGRRKETAKNIEKLFQNYNRSQTMQKVFQNVLRNGPVKAKVVSKSQAPFGGLVNFNKRVIKIAKNVNYANIMTSLVYEMCNLENTLPPPMMPVTSHYDPGECENYAKEVERWEFATSKRYNQIDRDLGNGPSYSENWEKCWQDQQKCNHSDLYRSQYKLNCVANSIYQLKGKLPKSKKFSNLRAEFQAIKRIHTRTDALRTKDVNSLLRRMNTLKERAISRGIQL